jgi:hypothetical protein
VPDPGLIDLYREECRSRGAEPGPVLYGTGMPCGVFVTEDVDATWEAVGPHALHAINTYHQWAREAAGMRGAYEAAFPDPASLRGSGVVEVVTPDGALALAERIEGTGDTFFLHPLLGGVHPDVGRRSLELFAERVLPHLDVSPTLRDHASVLSTLGGPVLTSD